MDLINMYKPIKYIMIENDVNNHKSRNSKFLAAIKCCLDSNIEYDMCLITRFDLLFQKEFKTCNINFKTINIVSILEHPHLIDDNFYLLPYKLLKEFYKLVENNQYNRFHDIVDQISIISEINYILNENKLVRDLSFYKIVRTNIINENFTILKKKNNNFIIFFLILVLIIIISIKANHRLKNIL
jgi:hypothetical protein